MRREYSWNYSELRWRRTHAKLFGVTRKQWASIWGSSSEFNCQHDSPSSYDCINQSFFKKCSFFSYSKHPVVEIWTSVIADGHSRNRRNNSGIDSKIPLISSLLNSGFIVLNRSRNWTTVSRTLSISFLNKNSVHKLTKFSITASLWSAQEANTRRTNIGALWSNFLFFGASLLNGKQMVVKKEI